MAPKLSVSVFSADNSPTEGGRFEMTYPTKAVCAVALLVLLGCPAPDDDPNNDQPLHTIHAKADLENGEIVIDYSVHDTALVRPGDRVRWVCDCDPGIQFAVVEPEVILEIEALYGLDRDEGWNRQAVRELAGRLQETRAGRLEETPEGLAGDVGNEEDPIAAAGKFLEMIGPALPKRLEPGEEPPRLFESLVPAAFIDGGRPIESDAVVARPGSRTWKFTWKFRVGEGPAEQDCPEEDEPHFRCWDPHLHSDGVHSEF